MTKKRLKITVDRELCDAHGICVTNAPTVFDIGDDDQMRVLTPHPEAEQLDGVRAAVRGCPKGALSLTLAEEDD